MVFCCCWYNGVKGKRVLCVCVFFWFEEEQGFGVRIHSSQRSNGRLFGVVLCDIEPQSRGRGHQSISRWLVQFVVVAVVLAEGVGVTVSLVVGVWGNLIVCGLRAQTVNGQEVICPASTKWWPNGTRIHACARECAQREGERGKEGLFFVD